MNMIIVDKISGQKVRPIRGRRAIWSDGAVTEAARPGIERGDEVVCGIRQESTGEGPASRLADESFDGDCAWVMTRQRYVPDPAPVDAETLAARIRAEAERRIEEGTMVNGVPFRCDTPSLARAHGLVVAAQRAEALAEPVAIKFRTAAGHVFELTSAAQAEAILGKVSAFVAAVLGRSAELQAQAPGMTETQRAVFDETVDAHWPA